MQQAQPSVANIIQCTAEIVDQSVSDFLRQRVAGGVGRILTGPNGLSRIVLVGPLVERDDSELSDRATQTPFLGVEQLLIRRPRLRFSGASCSRLAFTTSNLQPADQRS